MIGKGFAKTIQVNEVYGCEDKLRGTGERVLDPPKQVLGVKLALISFSSWKERAGERDLGIKNRTTDCPE